MRRPLLVLCWILALTAGCPIRDLQSGLDGGGGADGGLTGDAGHYREVILADAPVAYWRLGEPPGSPQALDETPNLDHAAYNSIDAGCTLGVPGAIANDPNTAVRFEDCYAIAYPSSNLFFSGRSPFSVEAWINPDVAPNLRRYIFSRLSYVNNDSGVGTQGYSLYRTDSDEAVVFTRYVDNDASVVSGSAAPNLFTHVVATYDGNQLNLYLDGKPIGAPAPDTRPLVVGSRESAEIGYTSLTGSGGAVFQGVIDEVAIYPMALDAGSVLAHYNAGTGN